MNSNKAHALVMGYTETALSVARSLGRRGIKVIGVGSKRTPPIYTRYWKFILEPQTESENERLNFFIDIGKKLKNRTVILPTFDPNVLFLSRHREILTEYFLFFLPPHDLLKSITSKSNFIDVAEKTKISLPPSIAVKNESALKKIPSDFFPCVLKPESQHTFLTEAARKIGIYQKKAIPVENESELSNLYYRVRELSPNVTIQKMIIGPDENHLDYHALIDNDGQILGEFVGRKLRLTPPHFGMGCYVISEKSDLVVNEGRRILRLLNYKGMANINFKQDERDGQLYFLELNPRFSFWTGLDVACGVDFPYFYYKTCLGDTITMNPEYPLGKTWLHLYYDVKGMRVKIRDGSLTWRQWILSVIKNDVGAIFALDDPLPAVILLLIIFKSQVKKIISRIRSYIQQAVTRF
jgi:predicted ATP-grasp superfamily ATP-dependent carboligase